MNEPVAEEVPGDAVAEARRLQPGWVVAGVVGIIAVAMVAVLLWVQRDASWPKELDDPPTAVLFSNVEQPTPNDLDRLDELVTELASSDPIVIGLLDGQAWPDPDISPVFWTKSGVAGRSVLIGGSFDLELGGSDYQGPWPTAGCQRGNYRGSVRTVDAYGLERVAVIVDLTFERVTHLSIASGEPGSTSIAYQSDLEAAPWYTGRCPLFSLPD